MVASEHDSRPMPGVLVTLLDGDFALVDTTRTSPMGAFSFASAPDSFLVSVRHDGHMRALSAKMGASAESPELIVLLRRLGATPGVEVIEPPTSNRLTSVLGRVYNQDNQDPLGTVEILIDGEPAVTTSPNGYFFVPDVPRGAHTVTARLLGYAESEIGLLIEPGNAYQLEIPLSVDPIELEEIRVELRSRAVASMLEGVWFRMNHNRHLGGIFITRNDLDLRGNPPLSSLLQGTPGVKVLKLSPSEFLVGLRGKRLCRGNPTMFLDGIKISTNRQTLDLDIVPTMDIEVIEIYKSAASLPGEFGGSDGQCGAIAVWTRRGG